VCGNCGYLDLLVTIRHRKRVGIVFPIVSGALDNGPVKRIIVAPISEWKWPSESEPAPAPAVVRVPRRPRRELEADVRDTVRSNERLRDEETARQRGELHPRPLVNAALRRR
jgi:hypothetical protein